MKKNDVELTWQLSDTVDYAAPFSLQSVQLTAFETQRNIKLKETDKQLDVLGNQAAGTTYWTMEFEYLNFLLSQQHQFLDQFTL